MVAIHTPTRQPYVHADWSPGEPRLGYKDPIRKDLYRLGQVGPRTEDRWFMQHGRYLAGTDGLGDINETQASYDSRWQDVNLRELEGEDDVFGSGIFDTYGSSPTVHVNMGVFADHPSLPGYIDREIQYEVNRNISDITSGADVVAVPGGGMTFMERQRFPVPFDRSGPTPCPPDLRPPPPTPVQQVFASLTRQMVPKDRGGGPKLLPPAVPERNMEPAPVHAGDLIPPTTPFERTIPMHWQQAALAPSAVVPVPREQAMVVPRMPARAAFLPREQATVVPAPARAAFVPRERATAALRRSMGYVPVVPEYGRVGMKQIVHTAVTPSVVGRPFVPPELVSSHQMRLVGSRPIAMTAVPSQVLYAPSGYGQEPEKKPIGWGTYAFAGLLVGVSAALFVGATRKPKRAR